jgi:hypothetical protein
VFSDSSYPTPAGMVRRLLCLISASTGILFTLLASLSLASAPAATSTATCPSSPLSQPFLQWGDSNSYTLVAGGNFEGSLAEWTLAHGAQRAAGSEPYGVTGALGASSLALPLGASAQSPFTCVSANDPTFRFFARNEGPAATVRAEVVYKTPLGNLAVPVGIVVLKGGWQPTASLPTGSAIASALLNGSAQLALRFTALSGSARIDDVFIDPRMR